MPFGSFIDMNRKKTSTLKQRNVMKSDASVILKESFGLLISAEFRSKAKLRA